MARKFYIKFERDYKTGEKVVVGGEEFNHIKNVMRYGVGDELSVIDGNGHNYFCEIAEIRKNDLVLKINKIQECEADPKVEVTVFQALVKGEKLELIVQKLTELGITKLVPFYSEFCQVKPNTTRLDRLEKISIEALKQCGRSKALQIGDIASFNEMLSQLENYDEVIFAYEGATAPLDLNSLKSKNNIAIIIGSEGGFSEKEVAALSLCKNVKTISMGKRILRAETATIALSTLVLFGVGELN
jgi:16S rRNA (uracil1498-N3)-methyltransferase